MHLNRLREVVAAFALRISTFTKHSGNWFTVIMVVKSHEFAHGSWNHELFLIISALLIFKKDLSSLHCVEKSFQMVNSWP